jgi:hypothetical protein
LRILKEYQTLSDHNSLLDVVKMWIAGRDLR